MSDNCFTVDIPLDAAWLREALTTADKGGVVRVTVVIANAGPQATYKAAVLGGGECEYVVACMCGDFTREPAWRGEKP